MADDRNTILFVKYGSFSHVNEHIVTILRERFPECEVCVIDVAHDILASYGFRSTLLRVYSSLRHIVPFLRNRHSQWDFAFRYAVTWKWVRHWVAANVNPREVRFILQTQSVFNAAHPEVPFFIYTDHTHAAHRRQPGGGLPANVGPKWVDEERALYHRADFVFTLSEFCRRSVVEDYGVSPVKVSVASAGINIDLPPTLAPLDAGHSVVLFVGTGWTIKGGPQLADAFKIVRRKIPSAELWVAGSKPPMVEDGMKWLGHVDRKTLHRLFQQADLLCVPSLVERASMVALDAAAHGLPVIATPAGAGAERVRDNVTGILVSPDDTTAFADAIARLLEDRELARAMGAAGRRMVEDEFTWEKVGKKMEVSIRRILPS